MNMNTEIIMNKQTMSSLEIAEMTGKPHNDVKKAIKSLNPDWTGEIAAGGKEVMAE